MGREGGKVRQRGKKKSKQAKDGAEAGSTPSWVLSEQQYAQEQQRQEQHGEGGGDGQQQQSRAFDNSTPFGLVAPEIKSYFRTAHADLLAAESSAGAAQAYAEDDAGDDAPGSQHELLLSAALQELSGHELALATDPDTSLVLEYIVHHINAVKLRVLTDRLSGNLFTLATHRFGSHVLEAILAALQRQLGTPSSSLSVAHQSDGDIGTLRSSTQLIIDFAAELQSAQPDAFSHLLHHSFGTHVLRSLLSVLSGRPLDSASLSDIRSKRSAAFRRKEGVAGSAPPTDRKGKAKAGADNNQDGRLATPPNFEEALQTLLLELVAALSLDDVRALSHNTVAAPTLGLLLELDAQLSLAAAADPATSMGKLVDLLLDGIPSLCAKFYAPQLKAGTASPSTAFPPTPERSDHMESALRDPIASHLVQRAIESLAQQARASPLQSDVDVVARAAGRLFWRTYIAGRTVNLASHPAANYIVQACVPLLGVQKEGSGEKADDDELRAAIADLQANGKKLVKASMAPLPTPSKNSSKSGKPSRAAPAQPESKTENRTGIFQAVLLRAGQLGKKGGYEADAVRAVLTSFGLGVATEDGDGDSDEEAQVDDDAEKKKKKKKSKKAKKAKDGEEATATTAAQDGSGSDAAERKVALVVPCLITVRSRKAFQRIHSQIQEDAQEQDASSQPPSFGLSLDHRAANLHGSLMLQAILRMDSSVNEVVYRSLLHPLNGVQLLRVLAQSAAGVHMLLTALGSATAPFKHRTALFRALLPLIVDLTIGRDSEDAGKWGSRVADACWDWADPFFKEKIAAEVLRRERTLLSSFFGNFFLKRVNVALYRREPRKWKEEFVARLQRKAWTPGLAEEWAEERAWAVAAPVLYPKPVLGSSASEAAGTAVQNGSGADKKEERDKKGDKKGDKKRKGAPDATGADEHGDGSAGKKAKKAKQRERAERSELDDILSILPD
ncbi:Nucleolar protein 9 [Tilletia horrida]|nr:Nucleolar protein 9 [Tilletia horrida]